MKINEKANLDQSTTQNGPTNEINLENKIKINKCIINNKKQFDN